MTDTTTATDSEARAVLTRGNEGPDQVAHSMIWPDETLLLALLPKSVQQALGNPTQITLTIRPGDRLTHDVDGPVVE